MHLLSTLYDQISLEYEYGRTNGRTPNFKQPSTPQNQLPHTLNSGKTHFKQSPSFHFPTPKQISRFFQICFAEILTSNAILPWISRSWSKSDCSKWFWRLFRFRCTSYQLCTTKFHQTRSRTPAEHIRGRVWQTPEDPLRTPWRPPEVLIRGLG